MKQMDLFEVLGLLKAGVATDDLIREISLQGEIVSNEDTIEYLTHIALFLEDFNNTNFDAEIEHHISFLHSRVISKTHNNVGFVFYTKVSNQ